MPPQLLKMHSQLCSNILCTACCRDQEVYLDALVSICDESYEKAEHHVDEEGDERVEVDPAEQPHHDVLLRELSKRREHVVPVHQGEEAFGHAAQTLKLAHLLQIHADIRDNTRLITCLKDYVQEGKKKTRGHFHTSIA